MVRTSTPKSSILVSFPLFSPSILGGLPPLVLVQHPFEQPYYPSYYPMKPSPKYCQGHAGHLSAAPWLPTTWRVRCVTLRKFMASQQYFNLGNLWKSGESLTVPNLDSWADLTPDANPLTLSEIGTACVYALAYEKCQIMPSFHSCYILVSNCIVLSCTFSDLWSNLQPFFGWQWTGGCLQTSLHQRICRQSEPLQFARLSGSVSYTLFSCQCKSSLKFYTPEN